MPGPRRLTNNPLAFDRGADWISHVGHRMQTPTRAAGKAGRKAPPADRLVLSEIELAQALGISRCWLQHDRRSKRVLPYFRIGGLIRYDMARVTLALAALEEGGI